MVSASVSRLASRVTRVVATVCVLAGAWFAATPEALAQPASQQPSSTLAATTPDEPEGIPILYRGREIFRVRRALGPVTAVQRAETIQALLDANVRADTSPDDFNVVEFPAYTEIRLRDVVIGVVTDQDAEAVGLPRQLVATRVLTQLKLVVIQARAEFTPAPSPSASASSSSARSSWPCCCGESLASIGACWGRLMSGVDGSSSVFASSECSWSRQSARPRPSPP